MADARNLQPEVGKQDDYDNSNNKTTANATIDNAIQASTIKMIDKSETDDKTLTSKETLVDPKNVKNPPATAAVSTVKSTEDIPANSGDDVPIVIIDDDDAKDQILLPVGYAALASKPADLSRSQASNAMITASSSSSGIRLPAPNPLPLTRTKTMVSRARAEQGKPARTQYKPKVSNTACQLIFPWSFQLIVLC